MVRVDLVEESRRATEEDDSDDDSDSGLGKVKEERYSSRETSMGNRVSCHVRRPGTYIRRNGDKRERQRINERKKELTLYNEG